MNISLTDMSRRERAAVIGGGVLVLLLFCYVIFVKPLCDEYARLKVEVPVKRADLQWMQSVAAESKSAPKEIRRNGSASSLLKQIDQSARLNGISANLVRVEPVGDSGVRLWLEKVLYTDFLKWLRALVTVNRFSVGSMSVERTEAQGYVTVRLSLEQR